MFYHIKIFQANDFMFEMYKLSDVNFAFVRIDLSFGGCRKATIGFVSSNFVSVSGSCIDIF